MKFIEKVKEGVSNLTDETIREVNYGLDEQKEKKPKPKPPKKLKKEKATKIPKKVYKKPQKDYDAENEAYDDYDDDYYEDTEDNETVEYIAPDQYDGEQEYEDYTEEDEEDYTEEDEYDDDTEYYDEDEDEESESLTEEEMKEKYPIILEKMGISEKVVIPDEVLLEEDFRDIKFDYQSPHGYNITQVKEFSKISGRSIKSLIDIIKKRNKEIIKLAEQLSIQEQQNTTLKQQPKLIERLRHEKSLLKKEVNTSKRELKRTEQYYDKEITKHIDKNNQLEKDNNELQNKVNNIAEQLEQQLIKTKEKEKTNSQLHNEKQELQNSINILMQNKEQEEQEKEQKRIQEEQKIKQDIKEYESGNDNSIIDYMTKVKSLVTPEDLNEEIKTTHQETTKKELTPDTNKNVETINNAPIENNDNIKHIDDLVDYAENDYFVDDDNNDYFVDSADNDYFVESVIMGDSDSGEENNSNDFINSLLEDDFSDDAVDSEDSLITVDSIDDNISDMNDNSEDVNSDVLDYLTNIRDDIGNDSEDNIEYDEELLFSNMSTLYDETVDIDENKDFNGNDTTDIDEKDFLDNANSFVQDDDYFDMDELSQFIKDSNS